MKTDKIKLIVKLDDIFYVGFEWKETDGKDCCECCYFHIDRVPDGCKDLDALFATRDLEKGTGGCAKVAERLGIYRLTWRKLDDLTI